MLDKTLEIILNGGCLMNITTEPIRDRKKVKEILAYLRGKNPRNYLMAKVQLNTALRISDVLKLKVSDFIYPSLRFKKYITIVEKKTGKEKKIIINQALVHAIKEYIIENELEMDHYLFSTKKHRNKPISTTQAHRIYQDVGQALNIEKFNSHSLRKTWGLTAYKKSKDIALIMAVYNHTDLKDTFKYIGITQEDMNKLYTEITF